MKLISESLPENSSNLLSLTLILGYLISFSEMKVNIFVIHSFSLFFQRGNYISETSMEFLSKRISNCSS